MPELGIDMGAYHYGQGIKAIGLMYQAAKTSLEQQYTDLDECIKEYRRHVDAGKPPIEEREDGYRLWDQEDLYHLEQQTIEDAINELRCAVVISIYHHWEKHIPSDSGGGNRRHSDLLKDAKAQGIPLHKDIDALCYCANYLKHRSDAWRMKILSHWPDRFGRAYPNQPTFDRQISLSDAEIAWFIEIAKTSERAIMQRGWLE
jgi:hypothetical protein